MWCDYNHSFIHIHNLFFYTIYIYVYIYALFYFHTHKGGKFLILKYFYSPCNTMRIISKRFIVRLSAYGIKSFFPPRSYAIKSLFLISRRSRKWLAPPWLIFESLHARWAPSRGLRLARFIPISNNIHTHIFAYTKWVIKQLYSLSKN